MYSARAEVFATPPAYYAALSAQGKTYHETYCKTYSEQSIIEGGEGFELLAVLRLLQTSIVASNMSSVLVPLPSDLQETIATPAPPARRKEMDGK